MDIATRDWISLLRHRTARSPCRRKWLVHLADFRLHHELHIHCDLAKRPSHKPEKSAHFGDGVAHCVPCDAWRPQSELFHKLALHFERIGLD